MNMFCIYLVHNNVWGGLNCGEVVITIVHLIMTVINEIKAYKQKKN